MNFSINLLKADHIGIRDLKGHLSRRFLKKLLIITDHGTPVSVNLPYSDLLELADILDELADPEIVATVQEGRAAIKAGAKGISVFNLFNRIRARRK
ncbi:MAG: hypothetical protein U9R52_01860 [Candidatus Omnitrophota bacterium]|nr:hypothetical protein [Candidatus Omnitrophota bacterium]